MQTYYNWLLSQLQGGDSLKPFSKLLHILGSRKFTWMMPMDGSREQDAKRLRSRYSGNPPISQISVLEVMIALAIRMQDIMDDCKSNNTVSYFFAMLDSLGISDQTNDKIDESRVNEVIDIFLERRYTPDGKGGLFMVPNFYGDLRNMDIWYQAMEYLKYKY